jgi:hypothetical protein
MVTPIARWAVDAMLQRLGAAVAGVPVARLEAALRERGYDVGRAANDLLDSDVSRT